MAYQGFGYGLKEDGAVIQKFVDAGLTFFVSTSFSKSFSLYGERVGALSVLRTEKAEAYVSSASSKSPSASTTATRRQTAAASWQRRRTAQNCENSGKMNFGDARPHQSHAQRSVEK